MTPWEFRCALWELRWKQQEAAQYLGAPGGQAAISQWATGARPIPHWLPEAIRTHVALKAAREEIRRLRARVKVLEARLRKRAAAEESAGEP